MDKTDVERDDAKKQPQDLGNGGLHSRNDSVDGRELPHSATGEDSKPRKVGPEEQNKDKTDYLTNDQSTYKTEVELLKNAKSEAEDPNVVKPEAIKEGEDVNNVKSEAKTEVGDQSNIKTEADVQSKIIGESKEENLSENGERDGNPGENFVEDPKPSENALVGKNPREKGQLSFESANEAPHNETGGANEVRKSTDEAMADDVRQTDNEGMVNDPKDSGNKSASATAVPNGDVEMGEMPEIKMDGGDTDQNLTEEMVDVPKEPVNKDVSATAVADGNAKWGATPITKHEVNDALVANHQEPATPHALLQCQSTKAGSHSRETYRNVFNEAKILGDEDGTPEEQAAFMRELESFYRERAMEFKPPRFYGQTLNCLKLWRAVTRLGGYDLVTGSKLWRQVGESFHPPKTCTTVSWTFRIFYEKALLEYERYKRESGELQLPPHALADPSGVDHEGNGYQASGSGRARRDAAARAMQGWHARLFGDGEVGEATVKEKNVNNMPKREKNLKSIASLKQKRPNEVEHPVKAARTETSRQLVASVDDVGAPADWVKINVRETKDCFEVYALVPGLLREEVRVQSDPAGRLVITGQPEQPDNPWGITAFKKVVSLPGRIDPLQTSAVVSLHGRLLVRVPFEQSNI